MDLDADKSFSRNNNKKLGHSNSHDGQKQPQQKVKPVGRGFPYVLETDG